MFLAPFPESQALWDQCVNKERRKRKAAPARACITPAYSVLADVLVVQLGLAWSQSFLI